MALSAIIATAIIADFLLERCLRISHISAMNSEAHAVIDHLGGTSAVAKMIEAPLSTVHSWRTIGIPKSRLAHLRLAAKVAGKELPEDLSKIPADTSTDTTSSEAA